VTPVALRAATSPASVVAIKGKSQSDHHEAIRIGVPRPVSACLSLRLPLISASTESWAKRKPGRDPGAAASGRRGERDG
jgi:hypothetical protein